MYRELLHTDGPLAGRLHRVEMDPNAAPRGDRAHAFHVEDHAGFVVGVHDRDQRGLRSDLGFEFRQQRF